MLETFLNLHDKMCRYITTHHNWCGHHSQQVSCRGRVREDNHLFLEEGCENEGRPVHLYTDSRCSLCIDLPGAFFTQAVVDAENDRQAERRAEVAHPRNWRVPRGSMLAMPLGKRETDIATTCSDSEVGRLVHRHFSSRVDPSNNREKKHVEEKKQTKKKKYDDDEEDTSLVQFTESPLQELREQDQQEREENEQQRLEQWIQEQQRQKQAESERHEQAEQILLEQSQQVHQFARTHGDAAFAAQLQRAVEHPLFGQSWQVAFLRRGR